MKRFILCFTSFLISFLCGAQVEVFNFKLDTKSHKKVIAFAGQSANLHYVFINKSELDINWLVTGLRKNVIVTLDKEYKKSRVVAATAGDSLIQVAFYDAKARKIDLLLVHKYKLTYAFKPLITLNTDEQLLKFVKEDDQLHVLTAFAKNVLKITSVKNAAIVNVKEYDIPFLGFYKAISTDIDDIAQETFSEVGITQVTHEVANNLSTTAAFEKLYLIKNTIYFTFDEAAVTHLVSINMLTQKCDYKKMNFKLEKLGKDLKGNSFLIQNRLLRVTASDQQLNLCVVDLDSFSLVKNYNLYPNSDFSFKNTPIITENNGNPNPDFLDTDDFFENIMDGALAVAANVVDQGNLELMIGSQELVTVQRSNFAAGAGFGMSIPMSSGWGMGGYPGFYPGWGGPANTTTYTLTTYFKTWMMALDFKHIDGVLPKNIIDKLHEFEDRAFGSNPPDIHTIYKYGNKVHYGYYTKWNNSFYVVEF
jgi:hypothetical protein